MLIESPDRSARLFVGGTSGCSRVSLPLPHEDKAPGRKWPSDLPMSSHPRHQRLAHRLEKYWDEWVSLGKQIIVLEGLELAESFRVLAHEFAHELLHKNSERENRTIRETEADATAFACINVNLYRPKTRMNAVRQFGVESIYNVHWHRYSFCSIWLTPYF
ncbi:hypothetical protein COU01_04005 [Candidatus Falkowbacteria bacterium CG10_big_fil_rev_8_21_14_0_10_44_15]|uniref:IrrE N-terminal-like domain-containing protein n=1 Tax=Candidatus Falkowbacteria bacterium CG10_big_fil_rev_8_21_14_0_10_44_15 TaxID=1974569 RepID=A0A2H0UYZ1_9BACT|nr:MAG: hypothetical protein COU01_04005 [Candidatus Falkowbacteria bacterium CG10_big_fil_rev_8_21_14_0_10_44_15]